MVAMAQCYNLSCHIATVIPESFLPDPLKSSDESDAYGSMVTSFHFPLTFNPYKIPIGLHRDLQTEPALHDISQSMVFCSMLALSH